MRCEDFLPMLESGGAEADAARRHAAECARCRAAGVMLERVKTVLSKDEPMPAPMRAAIRGVADRAPHTNSGRTDRRADVHSSIGPSRHRPLWFAAIAAGFVGAALGIWRQMRHGDDAVGPRDPLPGRQEPVAERPADVRRVGPITVVTVDSSRDLSALSTELAALQRTLADAKADAERLAVNQALDRVLVDFRRTVAVNDSR